MLDGCLNRHCYSWVWEGKRKKFLITKLLAAVVNAWCISNQVLCHSCCTVFCTMCMMIYHSRACLSCFQCHSPVGALQPVPRYGAVHFVHMQLKHDRWLVCDLAEAGITHSVHVTILSSLYAWGLQIRIIRIYIYLRWPLKLLSNCTASYGYVWPISYCLLLSIVHDLLSRFYTYEPLHLMIVCC